MNNWQLYMGLGSLLFTFLTFITMAIMGFAFYKYYNRQERRWMLSPEKQRYPLLVAIINLICNLLAMITSCVNAYNHWAQ